MTDAGARALACAIVKQAIDDFVEQKPQDYNKPHPTQQSVRNEITRFFNSAWFENLVEFGFGKDVEPQYIIEQTKKKAAAHDAQKARLNNV